MLFLDDGPAILLVALGLDAVVGDPPWLWRRLPHPVALIGRAIGAADRGLNDARLPFATRRRRGGLAFAGILVAGIAAAAFVEAVFEDLPWPIGSVLIAVLGAIFLAQRSLYDHVSVVEAPLADGNLAAARKAVSHVVGRDTARLDEAGIARAAIETTAESFCDGVVAPAFWFALFGLPGIVAYKIINTADSMIGHDDARHRAFGFFAAKTDDLANLIPARLSGALVALAAPLARGRIGHAFSVMLRDAPKHASPNAGWPEAAIAGGLDVALLGPTPYGGELTDKAWLNPDGRRETNAKDIRRGLRVYLGAAALHALLWAIVAAIAAI